MLEKLKIKRERLEVVVMEECKIRRKAEKVKY